MSSDSKDVRWLRNVLVQLLVHASQYDEKTETVGAPEHGACAKYADLLAKILPATSGGEEKAPLSDVADRARAAIAEDRQKARKAREQATGDGGPGL